MSPGLWFCFLLQLRNSYKLRYSKDPYWVEERKVWREAEALAENDSQDALGITDIKKEWKAIKEKTPEQIAADDQARADTLTGFRVVAMCVGAFILMNLIFSWFVKWER